MKNNTETIELEEIDTLINSALKGETDKGWSLILINDDHNPFELVIETLIEVCGHTEQQAEQSAMIVHEKGQYAVKQGSEEDIQLMKEKIISRGLDATVEPND